MWAFIESILSSITAHGEPFTPVGRMHFMEMLLLRFQQRQTLIAWFCIKRKLWSRAFFIFEDICGRPTTKRHEGKHHKQIFLFTNLQQPCPKTTKPHGVEERQSVMPQMRRIFLFRKRGHLADLWATRVRKLLTKTKLQTYVRTLWP